MDADACPVVDIVLACAAARGVSVILVCDDAHVLQRPNATTVTVSTGADSADFALVNLIRRGDIVVTQDYGVAAMALAKAARVLNQDGREYTDGNIDALLLSRHTARKIRRAGGRLKGPPKREAAQDAAFRTALTKLLEDTTHEHSDAGQ